MGLRIIGGLANDIVKELVAQRLTAGPRPRSAIWPALLTRWSASPTPSSGRRRGTHSEPAMRDAADYDSATRARPAIPTAPSAPEATRSRSGQWQPKLAATLAPHLQKEARS
jgi:hypothetical protein